MRGVSALRLDHIKKMSVEEMHMLGIGIDV